MDALKGGAARRGRPLRPLRDGQSAGHGHLAWTRATTLRGASPRAAPDRGDDGVGRTMGGGVRGWDDRRVRARRHPSVERRPVRRGDGSRPVQISGKTAPHSHRRGRSRDCWEFHRAQGVASRRPHKPRGFCSRERARLRYTPQRGTPVEQASATRFSTHLALHVFLRSVRPEPDQVRLKADTTYGRTNLTLELALELEVVRPRQLWSCRRMRTACNCHAATHRMHACRSSSPGVTEIRLVPWWPQFH
jgi:hypothetical protein